MVVTQVHELCAALPGAWADNPWGHEHPVIKVGPGERGKIFAFLGASGVGVKGGPSREAADEWLQRFPDDAVEELATALNHHLTEEELTILNPAREEVGEQVRADLGALFAEERNAQMDDDCGRLENVRSIVAKAKREGLLDNEDDDD